MKVWGFTIKWGRKKDRSPWQADWCIFAPTKEEAIQFLVSWIQKQDGAKYYQIVEVDFRTLKSANIEYLYEREVN